MNSGKGALRKGSGSGQAKVNRKEEDNEVYRKRKRITENEERGEQGTAQSEVTVYKDQGSEERKQCDNEGARR